MLLLSITGVRLQELTALCCVASECVCSLAVSPLLQTQLFQAGLLWCLLPNLFKFDFTLDEGGVSKDETSNRQVPPLCTLIQAQRLARQCYDPNSGKWEIWRRACRILGKDYSTSRKVVNVGSLIA